jgi:hypothetical protein
MTKEQFDRLIPGKSILKTEINGVKKEVLFKFFLCHPDKFDGYWLCVTDDMKNPELHEVLETDWQTYYNLCEVVKFE